MREGANWSNKTLHSASDWLQPAVRDLGFLLLHGDYGHTSPPPSGPNRVPRCGSGKRLGPALSRQPPARHGEAPVQGFCPCLGFCLPNLAQQSQSQEENTFPRGGSAFLRGLTTCFTLCNPSDSSPPGSSVHGDSLGKNPGVGHHALLQGIFLTQGSNSRLPH